MRKKQVKSNLYIYTFFKIVPIWLWNIRFKYTTGRYSEQPPEQPAYTSWQRYHGKMDVKIFLMRKRKRSDSVLWQKPLHKQKCQNGKVTTQTTPQKSSIKQRLRTDLGRSVGVTTATQLVWLTGLRAHLPTNRNTVCYVHSSSMLCSQ